jgi:hypothetical protein
VSLGGALRLWVRLSLLFALGVVLLGIADDAGLPAARALLSHLPGITKAAPHAPASPPSASPTARADIPTSYRRWYQQAAKSCPHLPWAVLAAVGKVESDHGRSRLPGVRSDANWAGAAGPMQLGIGAKAGPTWQRYRVDADHDGASVYDPPDAITAAAHKLCADGASHGDLKGALFAYNHSGRYVDRVLALARRYTTTRRAGR